MYIFSITIRMPYPHVEVLADVPRCRQTAVSDIAELQLPLLYTKIKPDQMHRLTHLGFSTYTLMPRGHG